MIARWSAWILGGVLVSLLLVPFSNLGASGSAPPARPPGLMANVLDSAIVELSRGAGPFAATHEMGPGPRVACHLMSPTTAHCTAAGSVPLASSGSKWSDIPTNGSPGPVELGMMTYFPPLKEVVLFGGSDVSPTNQTWVFKAKTWVNLTSRVGPSPSARFGGGFIYDVADGFALLFGGTSGTVVYNDTWLFNGTAWVQFFPVTSPPPLYRFGMTYDTRDGYAVVFGGAGQHGLLHETWSFSAKSWTNMTPKNGPLGREDPSLTYDAKDGYVVLFGGMNYLGVANSTTWKFHAGKWVRFMPSTHPVPLSGATMAYDSYLREVILFGGSDSARSYDMTWAFSGGTWTNLTSLLTVTPGPTSSGMAVDDGASHNLLLFGGFNGTALSNDTWIFH